jgi:hypothetical protein
MVFRLWAGQYRNFLPGDSVPDPGSVAFFTPGSGMDKKIKIRIRDPESLETIYWVSNT